LWLDSVTVFERHNIPVEAWSKAEWLDASFNSWREMVEPVAAEVTQAMVLPGTDNVPEELSQLLGNSGFLNNLGSTFFGIQMAQALASLAKEVYSSTDIGFPLAPGRTALVAPALILTTIFFFIPMVLSLWWSFTKYNGNRPPQYVGLKNYADLMSDPTFTAAASNTAVFAIVTMTIGPFLGLVSALLLNRARAFQAFFRSAFFLPVTMSLVVVASMWKMILNDAGLLNKFLEFFGIPGHDWLADPSTSLMSVSMASIWQGFGFETVIFLAALQSIPREHYEAAAVDGAGPLRTFMAVTLPALRPTLLFVYVMGTIGAFQVFDQIYVMTQGGPTSSTTTLVYYIVERFHSFDLGKASAAAYLLAAFLAVASAIQMKIERRGA